MYDAFSYFFFLVPRNELLELLFSRQRNGWHGYQIFGDLIVGENVNVNVGESNTESQNLKDKWEIIWEKY